jgi:phospholipase C
MKVGYLLKPFFQIASHMELAEAAANILANDGREDIVSFLYSTDGASGRRYIERLAAGTRAADLPCSRNYVCTLSHFHHPWTHRGYITGRSSAAVAAQLFDRALSLWQDAKCGEAVFQLGRALHLLQDIFIPHHSGVTALKGHAALEKWLTANWRSFTAEKGGLYHWRRDFYDKDGNCHHVASENPYDWIDHGSHISIAWYEKYFAAGKYNEDIFLAVAPLIIPFALRFSAGFIALFFRCIKT